MEESEKYTSRIDESWVPSRKESLFPRVSRTQHSSHPSTNIPQPSSSLTSHLQTLYLLTASDLIPVLCPQLLFALSSILNPSLHTSTPDTLTILTHLPHALLWIWLHLLLLGLSNQRQRASIAEDAVNKPWRPIPSGRLDQHHARYLLLCMIPVTYILSHYVLGATFETAALFVFNWIYNDLDAAEDLVLRNVLNVLGMTTIGVGARAVLTGESVYAMSDEEMMWVLVCGGVILTTIQVQDLKDQEGDGKRGRRTVPLVIGDGAARWGTAGAVGAWSVAVPGYWGMGSVVGWVVPLVLGGVVAGRMLVYRDVVSDRRTYIVWALWVVSVYMMPVMKMMFG